MNSLLVTTIKQKKTICQPSLYLLIKCCPLALETVLRGIMFIIISTGLFSYTDYRTLATNTNHTLKRKKTDLSKGHTAWYST